MPNNEKHQLDSKLLLTIAIAMKASNRPVGSDYIGMFDYVLIAKWLGVLEYQQYAGTIHIDKAIKNHLTIGLFLATGCSEDYVALHMMQYEFNKYKELLNG